jgi:hypothetical protein
MKPEEAENSSVRLLLDITADILGTHIRIINAYLVFIYKVFTFRQDFCGITGKEEVTATNKNNI